MDSGTISAWGAKLIDLCSSVGTKIILALLIFIIGRIVIKKILTLLEGRKFTEEEKALLGEMENQQDSREQHQ